MKKKKILVTGATGFIGANLARYLVSNQQEIHIIIRETSDLWRIKDIISYAATYNLDLEDREKTRKIIKLIKPDVVFHLANLGLYAGVNSSPRRLIDVNFLGTTNLLEACANLNLQCFVNTGSSAEYGPKESIMVEKDYCQPTTFYGLSKLTATLYSTVAAKTTKLPIICLRIFSPYGPFDSSTRLIPYVITRALKDRELLLANPRSVRDFIFVDDVVSAYLQTINNAKKNRGEIFNVGSGIQTSVADIVNQIIKIIGSKSRIKWGVQKSRPQESPSWQADITFAKSKLYWEPKYSLESGLRKTIEWFAQNISYYD